MPGICDALNATTSTAGSARNTTLKSWKSRPAAPMMIRRRRLMSASPRVFLVARKPPAASWPAPARGRAGRPAGACPSGPAADRPGRAPESPSQDILTGRGERRQAPDSIRAAVTSCRGEVVSGHRRQLPAPAPAPRVKMHVLVVEDDPKLGRLLTRLLQDDRHVVELAADGTTGLELARDARGIDAVILDVGLPDMSGLDVARSLRAAGSRVGILMLTAQDTFHNRVNGLDAGADDYLVKPFAYAELAARLRALGRRSAPNAVRRGARLVNGPIELDEGLRRVTVDGRAINLSPREFALLECLLRNPGRVMTRDQLLDQSWPFGVALTLNAVAAHVHYLRE